MKVITVYELLGKVKDNEAPKKIRYRYGYLCKDFLFDGETSNYIGGKDWLFGEDITAMLNDEVEIIEEQKEETKTTARESIEALGYACGEIQKCFTNGWEKSLKNKSLNQEDKKIRKIKVNYSPDLEEQIFYEDEDEPNYYVLGDAGTELLINKINEIIDYIMEDK